MQDEQIHVEEDDYGQIPRGVRWGWTLWCCAALGWYFFGYLRSLDTFLAPLYRAMPFLEELIGRGRP